MLFIIPLNKFTSYSTYFSFENKKNASQVFYFEARENKKNYFEINRFKMHFVSNIMLLLCLLKFSIPLFGFLNNKTCLFYQISVHLLTSVIFSSNL